MLLKVVTGTRLLNKKTSFLMRLYFYNQLIIKFLTL